MTRAVLVVAMVLVAGCGGQHTSTLTSSGPAADAPGSPSSGPIVTPRPAPVRTSTAHVTAGSGYASTTVAGSPPASSPPATIVPSAGTVVVVTDDASGSTVRLHVGQRLQVRLSQGSYDPPVSSAEQTLTRRSSTGGYPTTAPVDAVFQAVARGNADVTASTDAACFHTVPRCMMASRLWAVHVTVT